MVRMTGRLDLQRLLIVFGSTMIMAFVMIFYVESPAYLVLRGISGLFLMFFLPGYLLVNLLLGRGIDTIENLVLSVGVSISISILIAMGIHLIGMKINVTNIFSFISIITVVLALFYVLKFVSLKRRKLSRV